MEVNLSYGDRGLLVDLPDPATVLRPDDGPGLADPRGALLQALRSPAGCPPLAEMARPGQKVAVSVCDVTRPQPRQLVLESLLAELGERLGPADLAKITVLVATGTHRASTASELDDMLGSDLASSMVVLDHDARASAGLVDLGLVEEGLPALLNRRWVEADLRISTGLVEPHFFAGFSGGPKMVAPGLAGLETVMALHSARRIASPRATWGIIESNPVQDGLRQVVARAPAHFGLDVTLNRRREVTAVFAGDPVIEHAAACDKARRGSMRAVEAPFDVVVTTNSGYPMDQNLYQAIKGISAAAQVLKPGGLIVCAAECRDGLPDHGSYRRLLESASSPAELLEKILAPGHSVADQWQAQIQALIQSRARVLVKSDYLTPTQLRAAHLGHVEDIGAAVRQELQKVGPGASLCVLPDGPRTIPYLRHAPPAG